MSEYLQTSSHEPSVEEARRIEIEKRLRDADEGNVKWLDGADVINKIRRRRVRGEGIKA